MKIFRYDLKSKAIAILLFYYALFFNKTLEAIEIYRFIKEGCSQTIGLIINTDQNNMYILSIHGKLKKISKQDIKHILVYNTVKNPINKITLSSTLKKQLKDIYLFDSETPSLVGWPIQFVENMIVIYDLQGKTNLISRDDILSIYDTKKQMNRYRSKQVHN